MKTIDQILVETHQDRDLNHKDVRRAMGMFASQQSVSRETADKWISVEDRLPNNGSFILAYNEGTGRHIAWYDNKTGFKDRAKYKLNQVTYWMDIPEPPAIQSAEAEMKGGNEG